MSRRVIVVLVVLVIVVAAVWAGAAIALGDATDSAWSKVQDRLGLGQDPDIIEGSGYLEGRQVTLSTEVPGRVRSLNVEIGDAVDAGAVLMVIEDDATAALAQQSLAALEAAQSRLEQLRDGAPPAQITTLTVAVDEARRAADIADAAWRAARAAGESAAAIDALQTRTEVAQAGLRVAEAQLDLARAGPSKSQLAVAEAAVRAAEARQRGVGILTDRLTVRAPITGTVTLLLVRPGETVAQGQALGRIARLDPLEVVVYVPAADLDRVEVGQAVELTVEGRDDSYTGEVVAIAEDAEYTPKNVQTTDDRSNLVFAVTVRVANGDGDLRPGIPVDAAIDVG